MSLGCMIFHSMLIIFKAAETWISYRVTAPICWVFGAPLTKALFLFL